MSTATEPKRKPRSYYYGWDEMCIGESNFKFGQTVDRVRDAWNAYRRGRTSVDGWEIIITETPRGVMYRRVR